MPKREVARPSSYGVSTKVRLQPDGAKGAEVELDILDALGRIWGEDALRDFVAALHIANFPVLSPDDFTTFLQNYKLGIELTFAVAAEVKRPQRDYPPGALVLHNIRFYGNGDKTHRPFAGTLPFGIRFSDTRTTLIEKLGPPDWEADWIPSMRWDTARYALFAVLAADGTVRRLALQTPVVASDRPGFEDR